MKIAYASWLRIFLFFSLSLSAPALSLGANGNSAGDSTCQLPVGIKQIIVDSTKIFVGKPRQIGKQEIQALESSYAYMYAFDEIEAIKGSVSSNEEVMIWTKDSREAKQYRPVGKSASEPRYLVFAQPNTVEVPGTPELIYVPEARGFFQPADQNLKLIAQLKDCGE